MLTVRGGRFSVASGAKADISNLTITGGVGNGGGIFNGGALALDSCAVTGNTAPMGVLVEAFGITSTLPSP